MLGSIVSKRLTPKEEALFTVNLGRDLGFELSRDALRETLHERNDVIRNHYLSTLLNGIMAKKPSVEEILGLLEAVFEMDDFDPFKREKIKSKNISVTVAGSGKKGIKTVNLSSLASFVAACKNITVLKLCSPSTSSATGSQDFALLLGAKVNINLNEMAKIANEVGIGFFGVEYVLPKFAAVYSGHFYAPHALSFALAGMATNFYTDRHLYGLAHPNTCLSVEIFRHFRLPQALVLSSTPDGTHYVDEALSEGGTTVQGYRNLTEKPRGQGYINFSNMIDVSSKDNVLLAISQLDDPIKNVTKGLSGLMNYNSTLAKQIAINAAMIIQIVNDGDFEKNYKECLEIIRSGEPINKMRDFVVATGGDGKVFDKLIQNIEV